MNNTPLGKGISDRKILFFISLIFLLMVLAAYGAQYYFGSQYFINSEIDVSSQKLLDKKLEAEIRRIRSDTEGSLFWLKLIALFVTVGGAAGGYLIGQNRSTQAKLDFENRKNVDEVYQSIVRDLSDDSEILRATAAVKLGAILKSFPVEWNASNERKEQICQLTKQILAAALSIEANEKVLKTLSISLILHKPESLDGLADIREIDLSRAKAEDVYWARCDFEGADFYAANLYRTSFRKSNLTGAQFRESNLKEVVFAESTCVNTDFKMADLRGASFKNAILNSVNFENAKVNSVSLANAQYKIEEIPDCQVDISEKGDGSEFVSVKTWLNEL